MECLRCPACGAPLKPTDGMGIVTCRFCGLPVKTATDREMLEQESVAKLISVGNLEEAYRKVLALIDEHPDVPSLWLIRGNCAQTVSDRDSSYAMADKLLESDTSGLRLLEIEWTSMVFNWGCELSINDSTFRLGGMQRYRVLLPEGEYLIRLRCIRNGLSAEKTVKLDKTTVVRLEAKKGLFDKKLTIS